ncbi:MAG: monovalent cation/H(+) antiporter subunit G [Oscillospiraceae bacterium]|nr:monovalent cation/H(+) antiporter subunit G [Oscillospiraceae bacterium]
MAIRIVIDILMVVGLVFCLAGVKGLIKMPDTFSRMQASTCISTLGAIGVLLGGLLYAIFVMGSASTAVKIVVIALMIIVTNPIGAHSIAKGAYKAGVRPEKPMEVDDYGRDFND